MKTPEERLTRGTGKFINLTDYDDAIEAMKQYAIEYHEREVNKLPQADVYGLYSPEGELMFVHKTEEVAKKHQYEFEKAHGIGFYVDNVMVLD